MTTAEPYSFLALSVPPVKSVVQGKLTTDGTENTDASEGKSRKQNGNMEIEAKYRGKKNSKQKRTKGMKEINCSSLFVVFVCFCEKSQGSGCWGFGLG